MLNAETKRHIDAARDVLVGVAPNPMTQIDQITYALIYKFMDDMDQAAIKAGGEPSFFTGELEPYSWSKLVDSRMGNQEKMNLYGEALQKFAEASQLPELFRTIFRAAFLPYRSPETLGLFLKEINYFDYTHPEELGNAYEYLLSIMSAQGDAGQFRTPRHIIDFMVEVINPTKDDKVLDPACGTGGFLVASYNHIASKHDGRDAPSGSEKPLTPEERKKLMSNIEGYDIDPSMVRIAQVNMYLHQFKNPKIFQYDSLTSDERWNDKFDVILANPPFMTPKGGIKPHNKFSINSKKSEVLFVDYIANHLRPQGRAAIVIPDGVISQTGKAFKQLRKDLINNGLFAVVSLPAGIFLPYSEVKTSIFFIDKSLETISKEILFGAVISDGTDLGNKKRAVIENDLPELTFTLQEFAKGNKVQNPSSITVSKELILNSDDISLFIEKYREVLTYESEHEIVSLGDLLVESKDRVKSATDIPVWSVSNTAGFVATEDYFNRQVASSDISNYKVVKPNSFAYNPARVNVGSLAHNSNNTQGAVSPMYVVFSVISEKRVNPRYLYYVLKGPIIASEIRRLAQGGVRQQLRFPDLKAFKIPLPKLEIQNEIVDDLDSYLEQIDKLHRDYEIQVDARIGSLWEAK
jgi:type I restriction enzyme M protein